MRKSSFRTRKNRYVRERRQASTDAAADPCGALAAASVSRFLEGLSHHLDGQPVSSGRRAATGSRGKPGEKPRVRDRTLALGSDVREGESARRTACGGG